MLTLVLGGAASGKSEYAEALVLRSALPRYYLATMQVWDAECASAVFTIELKGTLDSTVRFVESLNLAAHMVMIGDSVTVVTHPASTTHKQLSDADLAAAGVTPTMLRISVGLENTDDLIDDFEQAFAHIG